MVLGLKGEHLNGAQVIRIDEPAFASRSLPLCYLLPSVVNRSEVGKRGSIEPMRKYLLSNNKKKEGVRQR